MGSSNLQCAISKETISKGDLTVTFILEPNSEDGSLPSLLEPALEQGHHYRLNSLPIIGKYDDFGHNHAKPRQDNVINLVKEFYGFDFSSKMYGEWSPIGKQLNRGEPVTSFHDTNTYEFVVLKSVYDIVIKNTNDSEISALLKAKELNKAFSGAIDPQLLAALKNATFRAPIKNAATFLKGLRDLGISLKPTPSIAAQNAMTDYRLSAKSHESNYKAPESCVDDNSTPREFCLFTKQAISDGSVVYFIPLLSNQELGRKLPLASYDNYKVTSRYTPLSSPIKCKYIDGTFTPVSPLDSVTRYMLVKSFNLDVSTSDQDLISVAAANNELFTEHEIKFLSSRLHKGYVVLTESAYNALAVNDSCELIDNLKADASVFKSAVFTLNELATAPYESIDELVDAVSKCGVFQSKNLESAVSTLKIYGRNMEMKPSYVLFLMKDIFKYIPPAKESNSSYMRLNTFAEQVVRNDFGHGFFHLKVASELGDILSSKPDSFGNESNYKTFISGFIDGTLTNMLELAKTLIGLNAAAITLVPFDTYLGSLTITEQRDLVTQINTESYEHCQRKLKEYEDEYEDY